MPEQRSVLKEYRELDEKRLTRGLSPDEQARFTRLSELVGAAGGTRGVKPGFDVNAAAAALRESLLPAGLRNRPPPTPAPPPPAEEPYPAAPAEADALGPAYEEAPPALAEPGAEPAQDAFFDPASLDGEAPPYDPAAQAYDPNAAYAADPNAAYPEGSYDASAAPAWDPNQPWDPNAAPEAQAYDPNAAYAADPSAAYPEGSYDASAAPGWDPNQPWDPNAAPEGQLEEATAAEPADPNAPYPSDASAEDRGWDPSAAAPEGGSFSQGDSSPAAGWDAEPPPPEPTPGADFGEYDAAQTLPAFADGAPLGEALPPEPEAELAAEPYAGAAAATPELGEYDDTAGFTSAPFEAAAAPEDAFVQADAGPPPELDASWQPDAALDAGFQAESGGSFGAGADAATPEWAQAPAPLPWESASALDPDAQPEPAAEGAEGYELSPAPAVATGTLSPPGSDLFGAPEGDLAPPEDLPPAPAGAAPDLDYTQPELTAPEPAADVAEIPELPPEEPEPLEQTFEPAGGQGSPEPELAEAMPPELAQPPFEPELAAPEPELAAPEPELAQPPFEPELPPEPAPEPVLEPDLPAPAELAAMPEARPEPELSFDVAEEPTAAEAPAPVVAAPAAAAEVPEEEIPTIDGADILEEIIEEVPAAAAAEAPAATPAFEIPGSHRVVVHTLEGLVRRGVLESPDLSADALALAPQPGAPTEEIAIEKVKAIFFMLAPGEKAPAAAGKRVRVTFRDGRQIAGFSTDYREDGIGFFMVPADTKTNTGRIWVFRAAVRQVSVS